MSKQRRRSIGNLVEVDASELANYASRVRRVCTTCGAESYLTVSPPVWVADTQDTKCLRGRYVEPQNHCSGSVITVRESWRLLKQEETK